ncbi:hypothetical protein ACLBW2_09830 [Enterobacteriaceae bacterium C23F]
MNTNDVYEYVENRNIKDKNFKSNVSQLYKSNAKWVFPFYDLLASMIFFWLHPRRSKRYFFLGNRFTHLIKALPKKDVCIIGGPRQLLFCLRNNISYIPNGLFWKVLSRGFDGTIDDRLSMHSSRMIDKLSRLKYKTAKTIIIVENDSLPLQRTFCNIAFNAGIETVCIQHGLFQSKTDAKIIDGWKCDHFICYDKHQKNIISGLGVSDEKIVVGGFYEPIEKACRLPKSTPLKICFLGQPWYKYGEDYRSKYLNIVERISRQFAKMDIEYNFKPHPWETDAPYLKNMKNVFHGGIAEAINDHDVFLSLTSTALLEVTMAGKVGVQIYDQQFACDNFEKLGYSYTIQSEDIENTLLKATKNSPFTLEMPDFNNLVHQVKKIAKVNL